MLEIGSTLYIPIRIEMKTIYDGYRFLTSRIVNIFTDGNKVPFS